MPTSEQPAPISQTEAAAMLNVSTRSVTAAAKVQATGVPELAAALNAPITMTSLELVDFINEDRKSRAEVVGVKFPSFGFAKLEHKDFLAKVPQVLGVETSEKFSADLPDSYGRSRRGYRFPKREACLMAMSYSYSYSYELQAKVFDRMTAPVRA